MAILSNVLGLDVGSHSLKAVEFRQSLRGFEVVAMRSHPLAAAPGEEPGLAAAVGEFLRLHRLSTEHVVAAIPSDRISSRRFQFPFRDRKKLAAAVPFEIEEDTLFDVDDILVDWEIVGGDRSASEIVAAIAARDVVSERLALLAEAGCEPRTLEAEGMALGNLTPLFDLAGTRLLVDLGHRKSTCCLLSGGRPVAARTVPVGGAAISAALASDKLLGPAEAERVKCEDGVFGASLADVPEQAGATLLRIAREITRTIASLETVIGSLEEGPVRELTLIGGTAQLDRIDEYLSEQTGLPASRLGLPIEGRDAGLAAGGSPVLFGPAIALALRGTSQAVTGMNFRQREFAQRFDLGRYRGDLTWPAAIAAVAAVLGLINIATATGLESRRARVVEERVGQLYTDAFPGRDIPANPLAALREEVRSAGDRAEYLGVYRGNLSALDLLAEVSSRVPADLDLVFEELSIDRQVVRMRVYATSFEAADRLGSELKKFPPFARARIGSIETDRQRGGKRFTVTIGLADEDA